jgi:hypothetical protein
LAHSKTDDASVQLKKAQKAEDGRKAMSEYEAEGVAMRAKTARLRALRLARDAAEAQAEAAAPAKKPAKAKRAAKAAAKPGAKLSEWLSDREKDGR